MKRAFASVGIRSSDVAMATRLRFIAKIDVSHDLECWMWQAAKTRQGYGHFRLNGTTVTAQRVAYAIFIGDLKPGLTVDHLCSNPSCVSPRHLEAVTHVENLRRGRKSACARNARKTSCPLGHEYATYFHKSNGRTQRYCPTCKRDKGREWMRKHRGSLPERYRV